MIEGKPTMKPACACLRPCLPAGRSRKQAGRPILTPCLPGQTGPAAAVILAYLMVGMASLACMTSTMPATPTQTAIPAATIAGSEDDAGAVYEIPTPGPLCATVTAIQSLHLRAQPNERARVLAYLHNGEQVRVIAFGKWWKISTDKGEGYANAKYLHLSACCRTAQAGITECK